MDIGSLIAFFQRLVIDVEWRPLYDLIAVKVLPELHDLSIYRCSWIKRFSRQVGFCGYYQRLTLTWRNRLIRAAFAVGTAFVRLGSEGNR